ncbi:MAG: histidine kinase [Agriterribacter sp.]
MVFYPVNNPVLQQYDIRKITIGNDGKLWLSADKGVISYDGNDVQFYGRGEGGNIAMDNKSISRSYVDSKGNLFCVIVWGKIYYLNTKTGKVDYVDIYVPKEDSSEFDKIRPYTEILIDNDKYIWGGRHNMGFIEFDLISKITNAYNLPTLSGRNNVTSIQKDINNDSILWLGTNDGIYSFNKKTHDFKRNFSCNNPADSTASDVDILKIHVKSKDTIWFTSSGNGVGFYNIQTGRYTIYSLKKKEFCNRPTEDDLVFFQYKNESEYYVGSQENCPGIFNTRTHQYIFNTRTFQSFPGLNINHFVADSLGNLWCIIFGQLHFATARDKKLKTIAIQEGYEQNQVNNIFKTVIWDDKRKYYYAAFDNSDAIFVLDSNVHLVKSIPVISIKNNKLLNTETAIYDIALDQKGRLWSSGNILRVYDSGLQKMLPIHKVFPDLLFNTQHFQNIISRGNHLYLQPSDNSCRAIYRINTDNLSYDSIVLSNYDLLNKIVTFESEKKLDVLIIDKAEQYAYFGIHNTVFQLNLKTKVTKEVTTINTKEFQHFFNMFWYLLDDDNHLWVNSNNGIVIYDPISLEPVRQISHPEGTYRLQFFNIEGKGIMCVLFSGGILFFDYKNLTQYELSLNDGLITFLNSSVSCVHNTLFVGAELNALQHIPLSSVINRKRERSCYLSNIQLFGKAYFTDTLPEYIQSLTLPHDQNFISLTFSSTEFEQPEKLEYRYKLTGIDEYWILANFSKRTVSYSNLKPGSYKFLAFVKNPDGEWSQNQVNLQIIILPAWWQTTIFKIFSIIASLAILIFIIKWRINAVRKEEQRKAKIQHQLLELEAKALHAQMNPHFIFNCLNSIKSLIQQHEEEKAVTYLTTFSKLIRTLFNNADKKEISLYDEIETCKLYLQLEAMRFDAKFSYSVYVDESLDLKSIKVPALIIQPFIENAIWHGIIPKGASGNIKLEVQQKNNSIEIIIDDDGIGREAARLNKAAANIGHQSKGVNLTQSRLELDNLLQQRKAELEIIDKTDGKSGPCGTTITIKMNESLL